MQKGPFNLEIAVAAWRAFQAQRRVYLPEDLDELESHLREHTHRLTQQGMEGRAAFNEALQSIGDFDAEEYGKIYWSKLKRRRQLMHELVWRLSMFKNYSKVAFRALKKQKGYAFINIFGLAAGLACFILMTLFVQHEFSYDRFYSNADRIYRIVIREPGSNYLDSDTWASTPAPLASALVEEYPEVVAATTIDDFDDNRTFLSLDEQHFWEEGLWADAGFFDVFDLPLISGSPQEALAHPNSLVLSESLAKRIFDVADPIGKTLQLQNEAIYQVTGVMSDVPSNSSYQYTFIASVQSQPYYTLNLDRNNFDNTSWQTFITLSENAQARQFEGKIAALFAKHLPPAHGDHPPNEYLLQALTDVHLFSDFNGEIASTGNHITVYLFLAIAFLILILACINYVNLAIARSIKRAREVGMRKVVGAGRGQLVAQFLGEAALLTSLALVLALGLVHLFLPAFAELVERPLEMSYLNNGLLIPGLLLLIALVGLMAGSYPAFFMASLRPHRVLKGAQSQGSSRLSFQRLLIVGQYAVSIALVACGFTIYQQLQFIQNKDLGFDREQVVTIPVYDGALRNGYEALRKEWLNNSQIASLTYSGKLPTNINSQTTITGWEGSTADDRLAIYENRVHYDFLDLYDIELLAGRAFSENIASDAENGCLINRTTALTLGWTPEEAVGEYFFHGDLERQIIGVFEDFHMHSMHMSIQPLMLRIDPVENTRYGFISVKSHAGYMPDVIATLRTGIERYTPYPFEYQFLDDRFDRLYKEDRQTGQTLGFFFVLALLIASLGLFGLAAYAAEQRTKEIGIRKALGASAGSIVVMLTKDFTRLVLVAAVLATPIAYFAMQHWLESFAYHIKLGPGVFLITGILTVLVALLTVSYQAVRAAVADPVKSIRHE